MKKIKALLFTISVSLVLGISASCSTDSSSSESSDLDYSLVTKPSLLEETTGGFSQVRLYSQSKDDLSKYNFQSTKIVSPYHTAIENLDYFSTLLSESDASNFYGFYMEGITQKDSIVNAFYSRNKVTLKFKLSAEDSEENTNQVFEGYYGRTFLQSEFKLQQPKNTDEQNFIGWVEESDYNSGSFDDKIKTNSQVSSIFPAEDKTYIAYYRNKTHTITYQIDAEYSSSTVSSKTVSDETPLSAEQLPVIYADVNDTYYFGGWSLNQNSEVLTVADNFKVTDNLTLTANWIAKSTVTTKTTAETGDIVLEDGSYVSSENFIKGLTAVAVIFRTADEDNSTAPLGLGTVQGSSLNWASADTFGCSNETESLNCKIESIDENNIYTLSGTTDGSTSWSSLITDYNSFKTENPGSSLTSPEVASEKEKYQAFNFCLSYGEKYNLAESIKENWYLPTLSEFYCIYENLDAINSSLKKAGAEQISSSNFYWTSSTFGGINAGLESDTIAEIQEALTNSDCDFASLSTKLYAYSYCVPLNSVKLNKRTNNTNKTCTIRKF